MSLDPKRDTVGAAAAFKQNLIPQMTVAKTAVVEQSAQSPNLQLAMLDRESSGNYQARNELGYAGGYQFGAQALETLGYLAEGSSKQGNSALDNPANWTGKSNVGSLEDFLSNPDLQDTAFQENLTFNRRVLENNGTLTAESSEETVQGYLAAAHLLGGNGATDLDSTDANGTKGRSYFNMGAATVEPRDPPPANETVSNIASIKSAPTLDKPLTDEVAQQATELRKRNEDSLSAFIAQHNAPAEVTKPTAKAEVDSKDPAIYPTMNAWVKANGVAPQEIANYYQDKRFSDRKASFQRTQNEQKLRESKAWATDAELGTFIGGAKQNITNFGFGTARVAGHVAALPFTVIGGLARSKVDDRGVSLYDKSLESSLTSEESAYLDSVPKSSPWIKSAQTKETRRELMDRAYRSEDMANTISDVTGKDGLIGKPLNDLINPITRSILDDDLERTYANNPALEYFETAKEYAVQEEWGSAVVSAATGVIGLAFDGSSDMYLNPEATFEYIAENLPQLAIGAISRTALLTTNLAYGADIYSDVLADYKTENGRSPTREEASHMAMWALSASIMEQVADATILRQLKLFPGGTTATASVLSKFVPTQVKETVKAVSATTAGRVASTMVNNPATRIGVAAAQGYVAEGVTETYQTAVEENLARLKYTDFDGFNLFKAGIIGSAIGGTLSGSREAVSELANAGRDDSAPPVSKKQEEITKLARDGAVTGNVEPLLDASNSETYSPVDAVAALSEKIGDPAISEEERTALRTQIDEIIEEQNKNVEALNVELTQLEAEFSSTTEPAEKQKLDKQLDSLALQLDDATRISAAMSLHRETGTTRVTGQSAVDVDELIAEAGSPDASPTQTKAADDVIELMMSSFNKVSAEQVETLKQSPLLTSEQRTYVNNFSEAHAKLNELNTTDATGTDVILGRNGFKGVYQYELDIAAALRDGNIAEAEKEIASLENFLANHKGKQAGLEAGLETTQGKASSTTHLIRDNNESSGWRIATETPQGWNRKRNGGWDFKNPNGTRNVIERVTRRKRYFRSSCRAA